MQKSSKLLWLFISFCGLSSHISAQSFYDENTVQTIQVYMSQSNWDQLLDNAYATTGDYIMADSVSINGTVFDSVGVKYKGNSSYNANQVKNPWHIELDTYKDHDYQGYKDIKLANVAKDPSFLRDVLGYKIVRQYMDAPLANFTNLYVNGTLIGLYSNTEAISKSFVKDRFGNKTNSFFSCSPPAGAGPNSTDLPTLEYLGTDSTNYYEAYEIKSDAGWQDLINLCDTLKNNTSAIENVLDVDRAIWMLALDNAIVNLDSYIGVFSQNYYLYQDDYGRFLPVIWDLNESFGTFSNTGAGTLNSTTPKQQMSHLLHSGDANFPLISKLLAIPTYKKMYLAHMKTILEENFTNNGNYYTMAQSLQNTASASVQADPNKFYTYAQFTSNLTTDVSSGGPGPQGQSIPGITNLMNGRYTYLMSQSDFTATQPNISNINVSNSSLVIGNTVTITATVTDEQNVYLNYRSQEYAPFNKIEMFDDGNHNDGVANDNVFGADIIINDLTTHYYIYAENNNIGKFSPARAQHEFYTLTATGGITQGDIVINEFMASNDTTAADLDGEYDDWIEIYNNSSSAIDISGYRLSDDITDLSVFAFPSGTIIQPNTYIIVWADEDLTQSGFHADFKISASGETLYLTDASQTVIDSIAFPSQNTDETFGRFPNGTGAFQTLPATFAAENNTGSTASTNELDKSSTFNIYPNPAKDYFIIDVSNNSIENKKLVIYNANGQQVYSSAIQEKMIIRTDQFNNGLYFILVGNISKKLLINR
ncbi:MAG: CotH kinase family protein [Bacteroidia bacterium]|nr:CotH kinase family protein [Bacteroidia bacterium]